MPGLTKGMRTLNNAKPWRLILPIFFVAVVSYYAFSQRESVWIYVYKWR